MAITQPTAASLGGFAPEVATNEAADGNYAPRIANAVTTLASETAAFLDRDYITFNVHCFREVDGNGDVGNTAAGAGMLASDTTPILRGEATKTQVIVWVAGNTDAIATHAVLPDEFDGTADVTLDLWVSSGTTDAASFTVETTWNSGSTVTDTIDDSATKSATTHKVTATIAAADVPNSAQYVSIILTPPAHATNVIHLHGARLNFTVSA